MNIKSQIIQEFHCKASWAPFSDYKHLSAPLMTTAWEPLDLPPPLKAAMSEIITFKDRPSKQRRTSSVFYWSSLYCLETGPLPVWIGLVLGNLPVSTPSAGVTEILTVFSRGAGIWTEVLMFTEQGLLLRMVSLTPRLAFSTQYHSPEVCAEWLDQ